MKKIKQLGKVAFLALALSFASCSSDDGGGSTSGAGNGTIKATVDGKTITTLKLGSYAYISDSPYKTLSVAGSDASGKAFSIQVNPYSGAGTYTVDNADGLVVFSYSALDMNNPQNQNNTWVSAGDGTTGTLTVTESTDKVVKGTFTFKGVNSAGTYKDVKNGSFNVEVKPMN